MGKVKDLVPVFLLICSIWLYPVTFVWGMNGALPEEEHWEKKNAGVGVEGGKKGQNVQPPLIGNKPTSMRSQSDLLGTVSGPVQTSALPSAGSGEKQEFLQGSLDKSVLEKGKKRRSKVKSVQLPIIGNKPARTRNRSDSQREVSHSVRTPVMLNTISGMKQRFPRGSSDKSLSTKKKKRGSKNRKKLSGIWIGCLQKKGLDYEDRYNDVRLNLNYVSDRLPKINDSGMNCFDDQKFSEVVTIELNKDGTCLHSIVLPQFGEVMGNHILKGEWDVQAGKGAYCVEVSLKAGDEEALKIAFDVEKGDNGTILHQREDGSKANYSYLSNNANTMKHMPLSLKRLKNPDGDLQAFLSKNIDERARIECPRAIQIDGCIYKRFGIRVDNLGELNGTWKVQKPIDSISVCGEEGEHSADDLQDLSFGLRLAEGYGSFISNFARIDQVEIMGNKAWIDGYEYEVSLQEKYSLESYDLRKIGYSLCLRHVLNGEQRVKDNKAGKELALPRYLSDVYVLSIFRSTHAGLALCMPRYLRSSSNSPREVMMAPTIFLTRVDV